MAFELSRIDRKYRDYTVTATLKNGSPATLTGVSVAILPSGTRPTGTTVWTAATYAAGVATVLFAGPDADPTGAITVPAGGGYVWIKVTDTPEVDAERIERAIVA